MPKNLQEVIYEMEELEKKEDDFGYHMKLYLLDVVAKSAMLAGRISEQDYYKIMYKYGGEY